LADGHSGQTFGERHALHRGVDLVLAGPRRRAPEGHVLAHREVGVQAVAVTDEADPRPDCGPIGGQVDAQHGGRATLQRQQPGAQPQQRGLAGTVRAAQHDDLAAAHRQRRAGQHWESPGDGYRVGHLDHRRCHADRLRGCSR
jgi:hypothetical protein